MFLNIDNTSTIRNIFNSERERYIKDLYNRKENELIMSYSIKKTKDDFKSAGKPSFRIEQIQEYYLLISGC